MPSNRPRSFRELDEIQTRRDQRQHAAVEHAESIARYRDKQREEREHLLQQRATRTAALTTDFNPSPKLKSELLLDICSDSSLLAVADRANIPVEELCLWMHRPDISQRLAAIKSAKCFKLDMLILGQSQNAVIGIGRMFESFNELESDLSVLDGQPASTKNALRNRESMLKGAATLARLKKEIVGNTHYTPGMSECSLRGAEQIPGSSDAPNLPAPSDHPALPLPNPHSEIPYPQSTTHPGAHRYPAGPPVARDPLPATHPAILSGAAPNLHAPSHPTSERGHIPHPTSPPANPQSEIPNPQSSARPP